MGASRNFLGLFWIILAIFIVGCQQIQPTPTPDGLSAEDTIGSVSEIYFFESIPLRGIGIVAGLPGTGSSECPPRIRRELEKYIWKQIPGDNGISPRAFIASKNTAVVEVFGVIPSLISGQETFDVSVRPLSGTQTISLDGGHLYTTELKELSRLTNIAQFTAFSKTFATVEGPIFTNTLTPESSDEIWYVLGGAKVLKQEKITLVLNSPDFRVANVIRNRINERFGEKTAKAISDAQIELYIPVRYQTQKERFLKMVQSLQLGDAAKIKEERIASLVDQVANQPNKEEAEIALEAIGRQAAEPLAAHLKHSDGTVQLHAARCMLNIDDERAIAVLRNILINPKSPHRLEAARAIAHNTNRSDARSALMVALNDTDIQVRMAAYEALLRIGSPVVKRKIIAGSFVVDSVACAGPKIVYVFQQQTPRIVLFGSPIYCEKNLFMQSDDGAIIINAKPGDKFVSVSRKHPLRPRTIGPLSSSYELSHLLHTLGELPKTNNHLGIRPGLAIPYDEIIAFLKKMCDGGAVKAHFLSGPPAEIDPMLKDLPPIQE